MHLKYTHTRNHIHTVTKVDIDIVRNFNISLLVTATMSEQINSVRIIDSLNKLINRPSLIIKQVHLTNTSLLISFKTQTIFVDIIIG